MSARVVDIIGQRFGRWRVIAMHPGRRDRRALWLCRCACPEATERVVTGTSLRSGQSLSCGCLQRERTSKANTTHGMTNTRAYRIWRGMLTRCFNPNANNYAGYGGREPTSVTVCERWLTFENFYADVGDPPDGMTLDRYPDRNGVYEPTNWRWATPKQQANNRRPPRKRKSERAIVRADLVDIRAYADALARAAGGTP